MLTDGGAGDPKDLLAAISFLLHAEPEEVSRAVQLAFEFEPDCWDMEWEEGPNPFD